MTTGARPSWTDADIERLLAPVVRTLPQPTALSPLPYDLNAGVPDAASLPAADLAAAAARALAADPTGALTYGGPMGFEPLRAWIAERQRDTGLAVGPANVMLTSGSAQAIDTIAATFLSAGDVVVMGAPTYPGAIRAFRARGARIVDVPQDRDGLEMVGLASALERQRNLGAPVKLVYVIANYDNPSGATLPVHRREELALLAARYHALVVEDDAYTGIDLDGPPPTSLFEIAGGHGILRVGTFSKTIATGLRVGWVVADQSIVQALAFMRFDNGSSPFVQRTVYEYVQSGAYEPHVEQLQRLYRERRDAALAAVAQYCAPYAVAAKPAGGFFLWLTLAEGLDAMRVFEAAKELGVAVTPGRGYYPNGGGASQLRLVYSAHPPEQLRKAIALLGQALAEVADTGRRPGPPLA